MKKFITTLILLLYLIPTMGITLSERVCSETGMMNSSSCLCTSHKLIKGCCSNKKITFKYKDSQQKSELTSEKFNNPISFEFTLPSTVYFSKLLPAVGKINYPLPRPPNFYKQSIYLLNGVLRI